MIDLHDHFDTKPRPTVAFQAVTTIIFAICAVSMAGCKSGGATPIGNPESFQYNALGSASARANAEFDAEARAFGAAQGIAGIAAAMDPTGLSVIPLTVGSGIAHKAWLAKNDAKMKAAAEADIQAAYRKYGMHSDGTPSGRPGEAAPE